MTFKQSDAIFTRSLADYFTLYSIDKHISAMLISYFKYIFMAKIS